MGRLEDHLIVTTLRMPRMLVAVFVGASLAVAGALMQALTRNPLASPQVFGVNAGASLAVVCSIVLFPHFDTVAEVLPAVAGAALGGGLVLSFASSAGITPVKLALAGMAVHLFLSSLTQAIILLTDSATDVLFWLTGSVTGSKWADVWLIAPCATVGITVAMLLSRSVSILGIGEDTARGLGERITAIKITISLVVLALAGASVAVAGPVAFVGLMVPHIARKLVGQDYRHVIPMSALLGAMLMVYADVLARGIAYPYETPVGIVTALLGAPVFLHLARSSRRPS